MYVTLHRSIISSGAVSRVLSNISRGNDALLPVGQILITAEACRIRKQKLVRHVVFTAIFPATVSTTANPSPVVASLLEPVLSKQDDGQ
jgi:hypothetical protein